MSIFVGSSNCQKSFPAFTLIWLPTLPIPTPSAYIETQNATSVVFSCWEISEFLNFHLKCSKNLKDSLMGRILFNFYKTQFPAL